MYKILFLKDGEYYEIKNKNGNDLFFETEDEAVLFLKVYPIENAMIVYVEKKVFSTSNLYPLSS